MYSVSIESISPVQKAFTIYLRVLLSLVTMSGVHVQMITATTIQGVEWKKGREADHPSLVQLHGETLPVLVWET